MSDRPPAPAFNAALIAGGRSRRMGRDKAFLPWHGRLLWEHQMEKLRALEPGQLLLSCREEQEFSLPAEILRVKDAWPDLGPLGGVGSCLCSCTAPLLVVLGIDLPMLPPEFLQRLLAICTPARGAVVMDATGDYYEPLAAVYPILMKNIAKEQIAAGRLSMQAFIRRGVEEGSLHVAKTLVESFWFTNVNEPDDLLPLS